MTLGFSTHWPTPRKDPDPTFFDFKILSPYREKMRKMFPIPKIHTFRLGARWRAGMSIQMVIGNRTKLRYQFNADIPELSTCISVQPARLWIDTTHNLTIAIGAPNTPDQYTINRAEIHLFAANEGFDSVAELARWFFPKGYHPIGVPLVGQIIHWTNFQYT